MALFYISSGNVFQKLNWSKLNSDLRHVCDWMKLNQLTLCLALRAKCRVHLALLIKRLLCTLIILLMFQNRFEFHLFTAISRKVFGKNVHATIPKGNMGYDQYIVPDDCNCRIYLWCFPLALANICPWPQVPFFQISLKKSENINPPTMPFGIVACTSSDNLSRKLYICYNSQRLPITGMCKKNNNKNDNK